MYVCTSINLRYEGLFLTGVSKRNRIAALVRLFLTKALVEDVLYDRVIVLISVVQATHAPESPTM